MDPHKTNNTQTPPRASAAPAGERGEAGAEEHDPRRPRVRIARIFDAPFSSSTPATFIMGRRVTLSQDDEPTQQPEKRKRAPTPQGSILVESDDDDAPTVDETTPEYTAAKSGVPSSERADAAGRRGAASAGARAGGRAGARAGDGRRRGRHGDTLDEEVAEITANTPAPATRTVDFSLLNMQAQLDGLRDAVAPLPPLQQAGVQYLDTTAIGEILDARIAPSVCNFVKKTAELNDLVFGGLQVGYTPNEKTTYESVCGKHLYTFPNQDYCDDKNNLVMMKPNCSMNGGPVFIERSNHPHKLCSVIPAFSLDGGMNPAAMHLDSNNHKNVAGGKGLLKVAWKFVTGLYRWPVRHHAAKSYDGLIGQTEFCEWCANEGYLLDIDGNFCMCEIAKGNMPTVEKLDDDFLPDKALGPGGYMQRAPAANHKGKLRRPNFTFEHGPSRSSFEHDVTVP
ncbi:hypothetical protein JL721_4855 [Aureococcus anophagefferens]|nr:hypothetical protein JL721_4855 [Aureococcus anophagefferens]